MPSKLSYSYPGLKYKAGDLSAFSHKLGTFMISLKSSNEIIKFEPPDPDHFEKWLLLHKVRDIMADYGFSKQPHVQGPEAEW